MTSILPLTLHNENLLRIFAEKGFLDRRSGTELVIADKEEVKENSTT